MNIMNIINKNERKKENKIINKFSVYKIILIVIYILKWRLK
jgi:hypothetical protein